MVEQTVIMDARTRATAQAKHRLIVALREAGTVSAACKAAGVGRRTYYDWINSDPDFALAVEDAREELADRLEAIAVERATTGENDELLKFLLRGLRPERYGAGSRAITAIQQNNNFALRGSPIIATVTPTVELSAERKAMLERIRRLAQGEPLA